MELPRTIEVSGPPPDAFSPAGIAHRAANRLFDSIRISNDAVTIGVTKAGDYVPYPGSMRSLDARLVRLSLEIVTHDHTSRRLTDVPFLVSVARNGEITLSSEKQQTPWRFVVRVDAERKQMSVGFTVSYAGLSIHQALNTLAFHNLLASGGTLRIHGRHPLTGGELPIASAAVPPSSYPKADSRLRETLEHLAFIERKTGASFYVPHEDITHDVANTIAATSRILEMGKAEYESQSWISVSSIEQARSALETFANGNPAAMTVHFEGQVVLIWGVHVMLGPVTLFCNRTFITTEDLEDLRKQLQKASEGRKIRIRFSPYKECPIEARYINWLPEDEAQIIRQMPMYQQDNVIGCEDSWTVPATDVANAISLLESWYDEDAEEQTIAWDSLKSALETNRLSDRKLFP